ncbi:MAG: rSAM-associated Gly-rich repeat protein, partial [Cyanobium sp. MAG_102]|nr:rSAM-associated Gly-rich repeat protein [Cyanobium sp. MAG_102]
LLLASLPLDGAAALALASVQHEPSAQDQIAAKPTSLSIEERLSRIAAAVQERDGTEASGLPNDAVSYVFVNGGGNGGFRNGGFYNGGFNNGGFYNTGFNNGGFRNGGFRNGGFLNGGRYWR